MSINYDFNIIKSVINMNPNLSKREKELILKLKFVFDEDYEHMDLDLITDRLSKLNIRYYVSKDDSQVGGECNNEKTTINYYVNKNLAGNYDIKDFVSYNNFYHEILHVFQKGNYSNMISELSNEFYTREILYRMYRENIIPKKEYIGSNSNIKNYNSLEELLYFTKDNLGYNIYINIYYSLIKLINNAEILKKIQYSDSKNNFKIVINRVIKDRMTYIKNIAELVEFVHKILFVKADNPYIISTNLMEIADFINKYYETNYNINALDDLELSLYNFNYKVNDFLGDYYGIDYHFMTIQNSFLYYPKEHPYILSYNGYKVRRTNIDENMDELFDNYNIVKKIIK